MGELLKPKENMKTGNVWTCDRKDSCQGFCLCYYVTIKQFIEGPQFSGVPNMKQNLFFQILLSAVLCLNSLIVGQQIPKLHGHFKLLKLIQLVKTSLCSFFPLHCTTHLNCGSEGLPVKWRTWSSISILAQLCVCLSWDRELGKETGSLKCEDDSSLQCVLGL